MIVAELLPARVQMPGHPIDPMPPAGLAGQHPAANTPYGHFIVAQSNEFAE
jgi:hypothetical protein